MCGLGRLDFIHLCHKMCITFIRQGLNRANQSVKFFTRLFILGDDFRKLCNVTETDTIHLYKLSLGTINIVHKHFGDSCLE